MSLRPRTGHIDPLDHSPQHEQTAEEAVTATVEGMSTMSQHGTDARPNAEDIPDPRARYRTLPAPVRIADTSESQAPLPPPPDSTEGTDPNRDFAVRYPL